MTVNNPHYYARLADCAKHYIAVERGGDSDWKCPFCRIEALKAKLAAVESWGKGHIKDLLKTADVLEQQGFKSVLRKTIIEIRKAADELTKALE